MERHAWLCVAVCSMIFLIFPAVGVAAPQKSLIAAGKYHTLAIRKDGSLWAWGKNDLGQLGLGDYLDRHTPTRVGTANDWVAVAAGADHSLALKSNGTLWAWGYNAYGELGLGNTNNTLVATPVQVMGTGWAAMAAGGHYSLGLKGDGSLLAWGRNEYGQFGVGTVDTPPYPAHPTPSGVGTGYVALAAAFDHNLAINIDGYLYSCGLNNYGQLGLGYVDNPDPYRTQVGTGYVTVAAGADTSFALRADGSLWAWGVNNYGELGLGASASQWISTPTRVGTDTDWLTLAGGGDSFTLGLKTNGSLWAWGNYTSGQLGLGDFIIVNSNLAPQQVQAGTQWVEVAAGYDHSLGLKADGSLWAWGGNGYGQLGLGDLTNRYSPAKVWPRAHTGIALLILIN